MASEDDVIPPVDVLDQVAVKRTIDDCVGKLLGLAGYPEDLLVGNVKLSIMAIACAVAAYAQLGPHTFPENKQILMVCVGFYAIASGALQLLVTLVEKNYIARTFDKLDQPKSGLKVATTLSRGDHMMKFIVEFREPSIPGSETFEKSVGNYFSEAGELDELTLQKDLQQTIWKMEEHYKAFTTKKSS